MLTKSRLLLSVQGLDDNTELNLVVTSLLVNMMSWGLR